MGFESFSPWDRKNIGRKGSWRPLMLSIQISGIDSRRKIPREGAKLAHVKSIQIHCTHVNRRSPQDHEGKHVPAARRHDKLLLEGKVHVLHTCAMASIHTSLDLQRNFSMSEEKGVSMGGGFLPSFLHVFPPRNGLGGRANKGKLTLLTLPNPA